MAFSNAETISWSIDFMVSSAILTTFGLFASFIALAPHQSIFGFPTVGVWRLNASLLNWVLYSSQHAVGATRTPIWTLYVLVKNLRAACANIPYALYCVTAPKVSLLRGSKNTFVIGYELIAADSGE